MMNQTRLFLITSLPLLLTACLEKERSADDLCKKEPRLRCEKLNINDGQCREPRFELIWQRQELLKNPTEDNQIIEYYKVSDYRQCLEVASQISPLNHIEIKERRFNALIHSVSEQDRIVEELQNSEQPNSLYFLWSQTGDHNARRAFLQLEPSGDLDTAKLQYALATFYISHDQPKTLTLLNRALELTKEGELNVEVVKSLTSLHHTMNNKKQAYMWAMVAKEFEIPLADEPTLNRMFDFEDEAIYEELNTLAEDIASAIEEGRYSSKMANITDK